MRTIGALLLGGVLAVQVYTAQSVRYDVVIRGGRVMDPDTGLDAARNVGILGDEVARITSEPLEGARIIEAGGLVVAPGFIELFQHAHDPESYRLNALDGVTSSLDLEVLDGGTFDIAELEGRALLHYGTSASHGAARQVVFDRLTPATVRLERKPSRLSAPTQEQLALVRASIGARLDAGDLGINVFAWPGVTRFELIDVFRLAADRHVPVFVRPRSRGRIEPGSSVEAIEEIIGAAAISGASAHIIHVHMFALDQTREVLGMIDGAGAHGLDITADARPYACYALDITTDLFGAGWRERLGRDYGDLRLPTGELLTKQRFDVLHASRESQRALACWIRQEQLDAAILDPHIMISGHAVQSGPQSAGTFARVIAQYVRSERRLSLMDSLRKMSLMPAQLLERTTSAGRKKGRMQEGKDADIVVFDPETISDRATDQSPYEPPSIGVKYLLVWGPWWSPTASLCQMWLQVEHSVVPLFRPVDLEPTSGGPRLVVAIRADFAGSESVTISVTGPENALLGRVSDVRVSPSDVEILWATPGDSVRQRPSARVRLTVTSQTADAAVLAEYELDHSALPAS
jgi:hypothetical protein